MCIHVFFLSIQDSEAVPEHTTKKFKPSVDSGAHCSKDLVRIDYFLFILHFELQNHFPSYCGISHFLYLILNCQFHSRNNINLEFSFIIPWYYPNTSISHNKNYLISSQYVLSACFYY